MKPLSRICEIQLWVWYILIKPYYLSELLVFQLKKLGYSTLTFYIFLLFAIMLAKLMHLEYQAPEGIILINRDHVIWFVFVKTQRFSSCSYWLELQEVYKGVIGITILT